jgi:hypothetical protein
MSTGELLPKPFLQAPSTPEGIHRYRIAMVIDGVVHGVLMLEPSEAAKYLSEPTFVQIPRQLYVEQGFTYDGETFKFPVN